jgi:hypothetical protein
MENKMVTSGENREPKRVDIYEEFVLWSAMPPTERIKLGIETQEQFVDFYKIGTNTPARWKRRPDYEPRVTALRREWAFGKTGAVIEGIYRSALKGNPFSQKLWLQYFHGFSEKQEVTVNHQGVVTVNDVISLIGALPKEQQEKHYAWVRELLLDASMAQQAAQRDGGVWGEHLPVGWQPRYKLLDTEEEGVVVEAPKTSAVFHHSSLSVCDPNALSQTTGVALTETAAAYLPTN